MERESEREKRILKGKTEWKRKRYYIRITFGIKRNLDHVVWAESGKYLRLSGVLKIVFAGVSSVLYADCDRWDMYSYLQKLIPDMLQDLRENHQGSPGYLGENYVNEDGILVNDTCHEDMDTLQNHHLWIGFG